MATILVKVSFKGKLVLYYVKESENLESFKTSLLKRIGNTCKGSEKMLSKKQLLKVAVYKSCSLRNLIDILKENEFWEIEIRVL